MIGWIFKPITMKTGKGSSRRSFWELEHLEHDRHPQSDMVATEHFIPFEFPGIKEASIFLQFFVVSWKFF